MLAGNHPKIGQPGSNYRNAKKQRHLIGFDQDSYCWPDMPLLLLTVLYILSNERMKESNRYRTQILYTVDVSSLCTHINSCIRQNNHIQSRFRLKFWFLSICHVLANPLQNCHQRLRYMCSSNYQLTKVIRQHQPLG